MWKIAIYKKNSKEDSFLKSNNSCLQTVALPKRYWAADPFLFSYKGTDFLFYELFDYYRSRGLIAFSTITNGVVSSPKVIIKKPYHLSFPYIFEYNNDIYIMPESCGDKTVRLFKAVNFPNKWVEDNVLLKNINACDTVLLMAQEKKYLLTSCMPNSDYCKIENRIYEINEKNVNNEKNYIMASSGDYGIRNGGAIIYNKEDIIRVGQDCTDGRYGKGLVFWKIKSLNPYNEDELFSVDSTEIGKFIMGFENIEIRGIHTYNSNDKYEVIDFLVKEKVPNYIKMIAFLHRVYKFALRKIRGVIYEK